MVHLSYKQAFFFWHPTRRHIFANTVGRVCKPDLKLRHDNRDNTTTTTTIIIITIIIVPSFDMSECVLIPLENRLAANSAPSHTHREAQG